MAAGLSAPRAADRRGAVASLLADRRPFGADLLVHPLVVFFLLVGLALIAMRVLIARPVPEVISDRDLVLGCVVGVALFLVGNFFSVQVALLG